MKEASWNDCLSCNSAIKITSDVQKSTSLIETANGRIEFLKRSGSADDKTINYFFEAYYSSVLEMLHALVISDGYKVNNHICLGFYMRDVLKREELFRVFDDCRYKRNSLVYYGRKMDRETAHKAIEQVKYLMKELYLLSKKKDKK